MAKKQAKSARPKKRVDVRKARLRDLEVRKDAARGGSTGQMGGGGFSGVKTS